ncbi:nucleolar complex protein 4 homolog B [Pectinophora gossypiella]|uniref:nucleolar complex protein 4 homolog B n=1 Tax=Pectinophora gossypiella TaxID=13191 RepID=UPI00214E8343|nr:nucleolar complex protein 4 homolog B [Pectinophora gossypiella]
MAAVQQNLTKMVSAQLRNKANEFLNSRKHANNLADILQMFEAETDNYTPLLLTIEVIFTELLKRGDLIEEIIPLKPLDHSPEAEYTRWLKQCYETTLIRLLECIRRGRTSSRLQALVTACKLMQAEGRHPMENTSPGYYFPSYRLKNIFSVLLDSEIPMSAPIVRFQEFTEYADVQQYGLKVLSTLAYRKSPTPIYMQNYLELLDKLLVTEIPTEAKCKAKDRDDDAAEGKLLCGAEGKAPFPYNPAVCRRYANRCWGFACQWPMLSEPRTHRRALLLLVERLMPLLAKPHLATDMLADSLDAGGPISMLALQGVLELVRRHNIDYPEIYDRLYAMFEPEMFATRYKRRLLHLADIFLSSTHLPEGLVAAFAKRLSRLALVASPEDATGLLQLVANLLLRHPALKRMICYEDAPAIMSNDPYVMEETCGQNSRALGSSLWEVAALRRHHCGAVAAHAARLLHAAGARAQPASLAAAGDAALFDAELKKRFKTIELTFVRPTGMALPAGERLLQYYELMA